MLGTTVNEIFVSSIYRCLNIV